MEIKQTLRNFFEAQDAPEQKQDRRLFYVTESDPLFEVIASSRKITEKIPEKKQKQFRKIIASVLAGALSELEKELDAVLNPDQSQQPQPQQQPQQPVVVAKKQK